MDINELLNNPSDTYFNHGVSAFDRGDFKMAFDFYNKASDLGSGKADFSLGYMYEKAIYCDKSLEMAEYYYSQSVERGVAEGLKSLGYLHINNGQEKTGDYYLREYNKAIGLSGRGCLNK